LTHSVCILIYVCDNLSEIMELLLHYKICLHIIFYEENYCCQSIGNSWSGRLVASSMYCLQRLLSKYEMNCCTLVTLLTLSVASLNIVYGFSFILC